MGELIVFLNLMQADEIFGQGQTQDQRKKNLLFKAVSFVS